MIELAHARTANALDRDGFEALKRACETIESKRIARCVVVRGAGGNFSSGLDLSTANAILDARTSDGCAGRANEALMRTMEMERAMRVGFLRAVRARRFNGERVVDGRTARVRVRMRDGRWTLVRCGSSAAGGGDWGEARRAFEDALERAVEAIDARHEALRRAMEVAKG